MLHTTTTALVTLGTGNETSVYFVDNACAAIKKYAQMVGEVCQLAGWRPIGTCGRRLKTGI